MTEAEWLAGDDPHRLIDFVALQISERRLRLIAVAVLRRVWEMMSDPRCRNAVEASEQFADGVIGERQLDLASSGAEEVFEEGGADTSVPGAAIAVSVSDGSSATLSVDLLGDSMTRVAEGSLRGVGAEQAAQACITRDIFGNPFRPVAFEASWRTGTAVALARQMYEAREFSAMPILADALQDAGCEDADVLAHCRGDGVHVRGCWVVDGVLEKL